MSFTQYSPLMLSLLRKAPRNDTAHDFHAHPRTECMHITPPSLYQPTNHTRKKPQPQPQTKPIHKICQRTFQREKNHASNIERKKETPAYPTHTGAMIDWIGNTLHLSSSNIRRMAYREKRIGEKGKGKRGRLVFSVNSHHCPFLQFALCLLLVSSCSFVLCFLCFIPPNDYSLDTFLIL
jgi:hypothetical protein